MLLLLEGHPVMLQSPAILGDGQDDANAKMLLLLGEVAERAWRFRATCRYFVTLLALRVSAGNYDYAYKPGL